MPHVGASRAGKNFAVGPLIVANELKILKEQFVLWCGLFLFLGRTMAQRVDFRSALPAYRTSIRTEKQVAVVFPTPPVSATGARDGVAETRFGVRHRKQFAETIRRGGLSNRRELGVIEWSFFWATYAPLTSAN